VTTKRNWCTLFGANLLVLTLLGGLFALCCIVMLIAVATGYLTLNGLGSLDSLPLVLLMGCLEILYMGIPLLLFTRVGRPGREVLKLTKPQLAEMGLSIGMAFGVFGTVVFLEILTAMLFQSQGTSLEGIDLSITSGIQLLLWIPVIAVIPAFLEEFVFRGIVLGIYERHMRPRWAILLSGVVFGLIHLQFSLFYLYIGIGIILGWVVYRSRSIWVGVVFHFVYNSLVVLFSFSQGAYPYLFDYRLGLSSLMDGRMHSGFSFWGGVAILSAAVFVLCLLAFNLSTQGRVAPKASYPRHPFVDWVPLAITLVILGLLGGFSLFAAFLLPGLT
jgi:uncharacterized protein